MRSSVARILSWCVAVILLVILALFAIANRAVVAIEFPLALAMPLALPLWMALFGAFCLGLAIGSAIAWWSGRFARRAARRAQNRIAELESARVPDAAVVNSTPPSLPHPS
jgi:uncharacterized integral membrane protein